MIFFIYNFMRERPNLIGFLSRTYENSLYIKILLMLPEKDSQRSIENKKIKLIPTL